MLTIPQAYTGLIHTGTTHLNGGVLRIDHNSGADHPVDRTLAGPVSLNDGTLRFHHNGAGHFNPSLTFTNPITVTASGGTIDFAQAANNFAGNLLGPLTLNGPLTITGVTGNSSVQYNFTHGGITLGANTSITNNTGPNNAHTINLHPGITGPTYTLTLQKAGSGTGFRFTDLLDTLLDVGGLVVGDGVALNLEPQQATNNVDPLTRIKANSGKLTLGDGAFLRMRGTSANTGTIIDPDAIEWQGNGTMTLILQPGGNQDSYWRFIGNQTVGSASGLTRLVYTPNRGYLTIDSPHVLTVGAGGVWEINVNNGTRGETTGHVTFLDGAVLQGSSTQRGGLIRRTTGTLTLGDGGGTPATPDVVTVRGNHSANTHTFVIGYAANRTESGTVRMRYASTSATAGHFFNLGWSNGGANNAATVQLPETSGGTEFAPLVGGSGIAVVGPSSGATASFAGTGTVVTAGTVGFYTAGTDNVRNALGELVIASAGAFDITNANGVVQAATLTVDGGSLTGIGTYEVTDATFENSAVLRVRPTGPGTAQCGRINASGTLTFDPGTTLTVDTSLYEPQTDDVWHIAEAGTIDGLPSIPSGYSIENASGTLILTRLTSGDAPVIRNDPVADVTVVSATAHGFLMSTGMASTAVFLHWGESDVGMGVWDHEGPIGSNLTPGAVHSNLTLNADSLYFYRFRAINADDTAWASPSIPFITGEVLVDQISPAYEDGLVAGWVRVARPPHLTNAVIVLNYVISGDATPDEDYVAITGMVAFAKGETNAWFYVEPLADNIIEPDETVTVTLLPGPYVLGTPSEGTVTIFDRTARELIWTDGDGTQAWNLTAENWVEIATPAVYDDGDIAIFDGTAAGSPIDIHPMGVEPGHIEIPGGSHTFRGGAIFGAAPVILGGAGTTTFYGAGTHVTALDYTGGTVVSNGAMLYINMDSTADQMYTARAGISPIMLDDGTYRVRTANNNSANTGITIGNDLVIEAGGGLLDIVVPNNLRAGFVHTNTVTLGGDFTTAINHGTAVRIGTLEVTEAGSMLRATGSAGITVNAVRNSLNKTLRLGGTRGIALQASNAATLELGGIEIVAATLPVLTLGVGGGAATYGDPTAIDVLANVRANSGQVSLEDGTTLVFGAGDWRLSDIAFPGNNTIELRLGGQGNTAYFPENALLGSAAGLPRTIRWIMGQNNALGIAGGAELRIEDGGRFWIDLTNNGGQIRGNVRVLDSGRLTLTVSGDATRTLIRGAGNLFLGDGNPATPETIEIDGLVETSSAAHLFNLGYGSAGVSDDGNITLRYTGLAGDAHRRFNLTWDYGIFRGGSAGTRFAPNPDNLGIAAVGPETGTVFAITNTAIHETSGTVGFYHRSGSTVGTPGAITIGSGAELRFETDGTIVAGDVTFAAGSSLHAAIADEAGDAASRIVSAGTLTFTPDTGIGLTVAAHVVPSSWQEWIIATAETAVIGVPRPPAGFNVAVETGTPHVVKLVNRPAGSLFMLR